MTGCYETIIDGQHCVVCPAIEEVEAVPSQTLRDPLFGWNASAYSRERITGDCYVQFTATESPLGLVVGLAHTRRSDDPRHLSHGIYVYRSGGTAWWRVVESGVPISDPVQLDPGYDVFRIERRGSRVTYVINENEPTWGYLFQSDVPLHDSLIVVGLLFGSGDRVD